MQLECAATRKITCFQKQYPSYVWPFSSTLYQALYVFNISANTHRRTARVAKTVTGIALTDHQCVDARQADIFSDRQFGQRQCFAVLPADSLRYACMLNI